MLARIANLTGVELTKLTSQRIFYVSLVLIILTVVGSVVFEPTEGKSSAEDLGTPAATHNRPDGGFGPLSRACNNGFWLTGIFLLVFSAMSVSAEMTAGTLRTVLPKPFRRGELFLAKAFTLIIIAVGIALLIELLSLSLCEAVYGLGNVTDRTFPDTPLELGAKAIMARYTLYSFILVILPLIATIFFGLLVSVIFENVSIAIAFSILVYLVIDKFVLVLFNNLAPFFFSYYQPFYFGTLSDFSEGIFESGWVFQVIDQSLGLGAWDLKQSVLYYEKWLPIILQSILMPVGYIIIFAVPSLLIFRKKDILV